MKKNNMKCALFLLPVVCALLLLSCADQTVGGGSGTDIPDALVMGRIVDTKGNPLAQTAVTLTPYDYNPVADKALPPSATVTTDQAGSFSFRIPARGMYNIQAVHGVTRLRALIAKVEVVNDTTSSLVAVLQQPGRIVVALPENTGQEQTYVYIPGTSIVTLVRSGVRSAVLDSVPAGTIAQVCYAAMNSTFKKVVRFNVTVPAGDSVAIANPFWQHALRLRLNTTPAGADVAGSVVRFPLLVRLGADNFDFIQAQSSGADVRFTKSDGTPLAYEIERWDANAKKAEVWVKVDTVYGNDSTQYIVMYYGNPDVASASNGAAVFDTTYGFQGVWHMAEKEGMLIKDATGNHLDGLPYGMTSPSSVDGLIGSGQSFNGVSGYIAIPYSADSKLNFPQGGGYSLSAWVYVDSLDSTYGAILSKGQQQYFLQLGDLNNWGFLEYEDGAGWEKTYAPAAGAERTWTYLVGVRNGPKQYLYVNGLCADSSWTLIAYAGARSTLSDFMIGKMPCMSRYSFFKGIMDEVRVSNFVPSVYRIRLSYMNQQPRDALVVFGKGD
jgi:hypothetical protein